MVSIPRSTVESRRDFFTEVYRTNAWRSAESRSGQGSEMAFAAPLIAQLPILLRDLDARSILDLPCGDFAWMRHVALAEGVQYIGADIVPPIIDSNRRAFGGADREFRVIDIASDTLPKVDVIFVRDCFIHFTFELIFAALANILDAGIPHVLLTHDTNLARYGAAAVNVDLSRAPAGVNSEFRPLNMTLAPFSFPRPRACIEEPALWDGFKAMALWSHDDIAAALAPR